MEDRRPPLARVVATRRGFLRLTASTAALTALSQVRFPAAARAEVQGEALFDPAETELLTQVMERMVETGEDGAPRVRDTGAVATVEALCRNLDPGVVDQLRLLLLGFEWAPVFVDFRFSRFSRMSAAEKDASIRDWMESRLALRRLGFTALRNLSMVGYYSQDETWPLIGYAGPLLPRKVPA